MRSGRRSFIAAIGAVAGVGLTGVLPAGAYPFSPQINSTDHSSHKRYDGVDEIAGAAYAKDNVGSLTVGIVEGSNLAWAKSFGLANIERKQSANVDDIYRIGSITKQFTAIAFLQLVQKGLMCFTDTVEKYVPEINQVTGRSTFSPSPTLVQLATHTSGLDREPSDVDVYTTGAVKDWQKTALAALPHTKFLYEPGLRQSYSNIAYAVLGLAIERASGHTYIDYVTQNILQPLGLKDTQFELVESLHSRLALGYAGIGDRADASISTRELRTGRGYKVPNGALFTTLEDLGKFVSFELGYGSKAILDPSFYEDAHKRIFSDGEGLEGGYGIGFELMRRKEVILAGHSGSVAGYTAGAYYNKKASIGIIYLRGYARGLAKETVFDIADVLL